MAHCKRLLLAWLLVSVLGCHHDQNHKLHVTAVPLSPQNQWAPEGIPYYLPKPLLVVAKNVRHIDESKIGLTTPTPIPNAFDDQSSYASIKANVTVPGATPQAAVNAGQSSLPAAFGTVSSGVEGLGERMTPDEKRLGDNVAPDSFFTYQIIFVPDLSQKYALQVKGGPGEVRAAMNLVNGWMYTGMGPYYMKNSSTAQNIMAGGVAAMFAGRAVADVVSEVGDLAKVAGGSGVEMAPVADAEDLVDTYTKLARALQSETVVPQKMLNYAEIFIYEPTLMHDGSMSWNLIAEHHFDRDYFQPKMNSKAMGIFQSIIEQTAARNDASLERARIERAQVERADAGATTTSMAVPRSVGANTLNSMPASGPRSNTADPFPAASAAPTSSSSSITDEVMDHTTRKMLGLPTVGSASSSPTQVNVNVHPRHGSECAGGLSKLLEHFHKDPPKIETRAQRVLDLNPLGGGTVGDSVTGSGTLPGGR